MFRSITVKGSRSLVVFSGTRSSHITSIQRLLVGYYPSRLPLLSTSTCPSPLSSLFGNGTNPLSTATVRHKLQHRNMSSKEPKSEQEWKEKLTPEQYKVLRLKGTEAPFSGKYVKLKENGVYNCAACNQPLYESDTKFDASCGWPAFYDAIPGAVNTHKDTSHGMVRTEMTCSKCGSHLGHVFEGEGYDTPTDIRHCVNSVSLNFKPKS